GVGGQKVQTSRITFLERALKPVVITVTVRRLVSLAGGEVRKRNVTDVVWILPRTTRRFQAGVRGQDLSHIVRSLEKLQVVRGIPDVAHGQAEGGSKSVLE